MPASLQRISNRSIGIQLDLRIHPIFFIKDQGSFVGTLPVSFFAGATAEQIRAVALCLQQDFLTINSFGKLFHAHEQGCFNLVSLYRFLSKQDQERLVASGQLLSSEIEVVSCFLTQGQNGKEKVAFSAESTLVS